MALNREHFAHAALSEDDLDGSVLWLLSFAKQSPSYEAWFLQLREKDQMWPGGESGDSRPGSYREYEFLSPLVIRGGTDIDLNDDSSILIHTDMHFEGDVVVSYHDPIDFANYTRFMKKARVCERRAGKAKTVTQDVMRRLLEEYPWLEEDDFSIANSVPRVGNRGGERRPRSPMRNVNDENATDSDNSDGVDLPPVDPENVAREVCELREEVGPPDGVGEDVYFNVKGRGGNWTAQHVGVAVDSVRGQACGDFVRVWCHEFDFPQSKTFSLARYGRREAILLAKEFCRGGIFLPFVLHQ